MAYQRILTASIVALDGHGKTDFLKTLPTPAAIFHIDPNTEESFEEDFEHDRLDRDDWKLYQVDYPATVFKDEDSIADDATESWNEQLIGPLKDTLEDDDIKAIGFDTGTELFELKLMADHGRTIQILPEMRTKTNYKFKGFLNALKRSKKHTVLLHRARAVYQNVERETNSGTQQSREQLDGVFEREGFSKMGFHVNVEAYLYHRPQRSDVLRKQFGIRVARSMARPGLKTAEVATPEFWDFKDPAWWWGREQIDGKWVRRCSFPYLATKVYPDSSVKDWM